MIAISFALPAESSGLVGKLESKHPSQANNLGILFGQIAGREIALFHTGVGRKRCHTNIELFLEAVKPKLLISSGFAGSLIEALDVGEIIIAQNFSNIDLVSLLSRAREVTLHTVDRMMDSVEERRLIAKQYGADAIDMETEVIARSCAARGIPMVSMRVISDSLTARFPARPDVLFDLDSQKTKFSRLIPYLLTHPFAICRLTAFARQIRRARTVLTDTLVDTVARL